MKNFLLFALVFFGVCIAHSQIINDNKFTFSYIQLPLTKIDPQHSLFEVLVVHEYNQANQDSIAIFNARKESAMQRFLFQMDIYYAQKDSIDRMYYTQLSSWEKKVNAGIKNADGTALPKPAAPKYPTQPIYPQLQEPQLHSSFSEDQATERITLSGFEQGSGEVQIIVKIQPIQNIRIVTKKYGSGSSTRYKYTAKYQMPVGIVVASPTEGILMETTMFTEEKSYKMANQKSQYDHELYMMDHKDDLFLKLESTARTEVLSDLNNAINSQFGYVMKSRKAEIYSVKKFKSYDYTDVTNAYSIATSALSKVSQDRDRSGAMDKLEEAINAIKLILEESNPNDKKTRINPKVTAMLHCNLAELLIWQGEFDRADASVNLAINSGEGKAKRHCKGELLFYKGQRNRWNVHF